MSKPSKQESVRGGYNGGWDLSSVDTEFLLAELIRRGYRTGLQAPVPKAKPVKPKKGKK